MLQHQIRHKLHGAKLPLSYLWAPNTLLCHVTVKHCSIIPLLLCVEIPSSGKA